MPSKDIAHHNAGLYRGYKNRNARLDTLNATAPKYLLESSIALANQNFVGIDSEELLGELQRHLYLKYQLLDRVIRARKLHHSHFFSLSLDYGHQHFLDVLQSQKYITLRALERLTRRIGDVKYAKRKWFKWVRECQDEEETHRDNESKRIKREAALFKRHAKGMESRRRALRAEEEKQRQEEYLDKAYNERKLQEETNAEGDWDPIEEVVENDRGNFVELIKHFLWQEGLAAENTNPPSDDATPRVMANGSKLSSEPLTMDNAEAVLTPVPAKASKASKTSKKTKAKNDSIDEVPTNISETKMHMRQRLKEGTEIHYEPRTLRLQGSIVNPELLKKSPPIPDDEIEELLEEVSEIRHLLFCRLLLSHAALLPAALRADSVEAFLHDEEISTADLRDLCVKMEKPDLQDIRDACADLSRKDEEGNDEEFVNNEDEVDNEHDGLSARPFFKPKPGALPATWKPEREKQFETTQPLGDKHPSTAKEDEGTVIDFGIIDDEAHIRHKKMVVKVCGRKIHNYRSERAMSHAGWFHFSIIARDSDLYDAIRLCRHWDEFFELNILAIFLYFPASNWLSWVGDHFRSQLLQLGFITYFEFTEADEMSVRQQSGSRGGGRRTHAILEARNFICAHVKRNDPASRRFIQYLSMQTNRMLLLVRDAKTGRIISKPPEEDLWLLREKSGIGRAAKNEWNVIKKVGPDFFKEMDDHRRWHFGFVEHYDLYIWDNVAGGEYVDLYNSIQAMLIKAYRFRKGPDFYNLAAPVLKTITRDRESQRVRKFKPDEGVVSLYDEIHDERTKFIFGDVARTDAQPPQDIFYNEADALEDQVLFPEEVDVNQSRVLVFREPTHRLHKFEHDGPDMHKFVSGYSSSESDCTDVSESGDAKGLDEQGDSDSSGDSFASTEESLSIEGSGSEADDSDTDVIVPPGHKEEHDPYDVEKDFWYWVDKEQAKAFKPIFHAADMESGAKERYTEMNTIIKKMQRYNTPGEIRLDLCLGILKWLGQRPERTVQSRMIRDMRNAYVMMSLFFPTGFFESKGGLECKDSLLFNQTERMRRLPPDRRAHYGNVCMPKQLWAEWDTFHKDNVVHNYPFEWDLTIRPIIARCKSTYYAVTAIYLPLEFVANAVWNAVFKEGVLTTSRHEGGAGYAIAAQEPGRKADLYCDYRLNMDAMPIRPNMLDPRTITIDSLRTRARQFNKINPQARFAVLKLWSAAHFYPFMIAYGQRWDWSFNDGIGRVWEWKFLPKDMPYSEWSVHRNCKERLEPFMHVFKGKVVLKRDLFLVMGEDEKDLQKLATAVTFAIQTRPWRLEVDLWKSFVNVDLKFLEEMDDKWLE
ncbi:hypothetical protein MMC17_000855 [Xylographa soralifera]|nr:hypothetical protein [Xylographa soralifera]